MSEGKYFSLFSAKITIFLPLKHSKQIKKNNSSQRNV